MGQILQIEGIAMIKCRTSAPDLIKVPFYITKEGSTQILGLQSSCTFKSIKFTSVVKTVDGANNIKQTFHGSEGLELIHKFGFVDNNGIGRTIETQFDNRNGLMRIDVNVNHSPKGHTDSDSRVHAVSRQAKHGYDYRKLSHKWKEHLPLGIKSGDTKQDLMQIFPKLFEGIGRLLCEDWFDL